MPPPSLPLEISLLRKERMDTISWIAFPAVIGRKGGNRSSPLNEFSSTAIGWKSWGICFSNWPFICLYKTKRESGRRKRIFAYLCAFSTLSYLQNCFSFVPSACAMYWLPSFEVVEISATTQNFHQRWKSNCPFQSHLCDNVSRWFKKGGWRESQENSCVGDCENPRY